MSGLPIVKDPITIKVVKGRHMLDTTKSYNEKAAFVNAAAETGISVEWNELVAGTESEKVSIMLAGGDLPDVFWGQISNSQILQNESQFVALEELIPTFAPNCLATYEQIGKDWKTIATTPSGHIYGMLGRYEALYENWGDGIQIVNKAWMDKVGITKLPTTLDEYYEMLVAFRDKDPNGNGQKDEIPYGFCEDMWCAHITNDMGMWGLGDGDNEASCRTTKGGKVSPSCNTPEYREYLEYMHKLYSEGLIDPEGISQKNEVFANKIKAGQVGSYYSWTALEYLTDEQEKDWVVLPPIAAKEGITPRARGDYERSTIQQNKWVITSSSKYPEACLRYWDYLARDAESKMTVAMGEKGILWDEYEDKPGTYYYIVPENTTPEFTFEHMKYTYGTVNDHPLLAFDETPKNDASISYGAALRDTMVDQVKEFYVAPEDQMPQTYVSAEAIEERTFIETDLYSYIKQYRSQAILDGVDDAGWDAYVKRLEDLRYGDWIQWYQDFHDGNLK